MSILKRVPKLLCEWTGKLEDRTGEPDECMNKATRKHKTWFLCEKHYAVALDTDEKTKRFVRLTAARLRRGNTVT